MKVELNSAGRFVLTAENEHDNSVLFVIVNSKNLNGVGFNFVEQGVADVLAKPKRKYTKRTNHKRKQWYRKVCQVYGCAQQIKNPSIHNRYSHGICADGKLVEEYKHPRTGKVTKVTKPVVLLPDGTYKVRREVGFLD